MFIYYGFLLYNLIERASTRKITSVYNLKRHKYTGIGYQSCFNRLFIGYIYNT